MTMIMVVQGLPIDRGDDREGELVIVGESDFRNGSRYIRISLCAKDDKMREALERVKLFAAGNDLDKA